MASSTAPIATPMTTPAPAYQSAPGAMGAPSASFGASPFAATPAVPSAQPLTRTPTPMPVRDVDPFGFGAAISKPPTPAVNMFATSATPAAVATPAPARAAEPEFEVSLEDISPPSKPAADAAVTSLSDAEFMEVSEADLAPVTAPPVAAPPVSSPPISTPPMSMPPPAASPPRVTVPAVAAAPMPTSPYAATPVASTPYAAEAKSTNKIDAQQLAELDRASAIAASAAARVVERAAPAVAAATGASPSTEALSAEARAIVERIAWEVVPELAETIIREEIRRLLQPK